MGQPLRARMRVGARRRLIASFNIVLPHPVTAMRIFFPISSPIAAKSLVLTAVPQRSDRTPVPVENVSWRMSASLGERYAYVPEWDGAGVVPLPILQTDAGFERLAVKLFRWRDEPVGSVAKPDALFFMHALDSGEVHGWSRIGIAVPAGESR